MKCTICEGPPPDYVMTWPTNEARSMASQAVCAECSKDLWQELSSEGIGPENIKFLPWTSKDTLLFSTFHALKSYIHGNSSHELAEELCERISIAINLEDYEKG